MYDETFQEVYLASRLNTMYLTQSTLKAQLLSKEMGKQSVDSTQNGRARSTKMRWAIKAE